MSQRSHRMSFELASGKGETLGCIWSPHITQIEEAPAMKLGVFSHVLGQSCNKYWWHLSVLEHLEPCDLQVLRLQLPSVELLVYDSDGRRVPSWQVMPLQVFLKLTAITRRFLLARCYRACILFTRALVFCSFLGPCRLCPVGLNSAGLGICVFNLHDRSEKHEKQRTHASLWILWSFCVLLCAEMLERSWKVLKVVSQTVNVSATINNVHFRQSMSGKQMAFSNHH